MNICIISVFNSPNQGSFQQLKELGEVYSDYGHVCYLDNGIRSIFGGLFGYVIGCVKKGRFKQALFEIKRRILFYKRYVKLDRIKGDKLHNIDLFVLGSDEIWDYKRENMRHPFLWGVEIPNTKISYAPSVGNADASYLNNADFILDALHNLDMVSVRDDKSKELLNSIGYENDIEVVLDPTLLKSKDLYRKNSTISLDKPYIALYCFQGFLDLNKESYSCFSDFANEKNMPLVSSGIWSEYAENIQSESDGTFDYMLDAEYVITNTFHGTAFAINFNKQFITFSCGRDKIKNLLKEFGLEERDCSNKSSEEIIRTLNTPIDYCGTNYKLQELREKSHSYIKRTIEIVSSNERQK